MMPAMSDSFAQAREHFLAGVHHAEAGRLADAERSLQAALVLTPGRPSVLVNLGIVRFRQGRFAAARDSLAEAVQAEPANGNAWLHLGLVLAAQDDADAALAAFDRSLAADPTLAEAWSQRGSLLRDAGRLEAAAECFEKAIGLGADAQLNRYYLAAVRAEAQADAPGAPPRAYVESLFDQYAADFDHHLVHTLGYRGHERLIDAVLQLGPRQYASALDLGCGTGLCGPLVRRLAARVDGVDLSAAMLEKASALGVYTELVHADVAEYLLTADRRDDLVVAADVFIYVGRLEAVFEGVARALVPGGAFCFTVEAAPEGQDVVLLPSLRYAHSAGYLRELAGRFGFDVVRLLRAPLREDQRESQPAIYASLVRH